MFGEGFCHFFISALHFWIEYYTIVLIFNEICITAPYCYSRPLSPPPISHRKSFFLYDLFWVIWRWPRPPGNTDHFVFRIFWKVHLREAYTHATLPDNILNKSTASVKDNYLNPWMFCHIVLFTHSLRRCTFGADMFCLFLPTVLPSPSLLWLSGFFDCSSLHCLFLASLSVPRFIDCSSLHPCKNGPFGAPM
jgi:hypothetical protein